MVDEPVSSVISEVCGLMDPKDVLLSIILECPYDPRKVCPIKQITEWRKIKLKEAYSIIKNLTDSELKELVGKHCCCSYALSRENRKE